MNKAEIREFIERMEEIGDIWQEDDVERVYSNCSLEEALNDRMTAMNHFADIIGKVLNYKE